MQDNRNWDEPDKKRSTALQALEKAKKADAKKVARGAHYCKVGKNTYKLVKNGNIDIKVLNQSTTTTDNGALQV